jgi:monofunctional biosynthetic peptidoglycan transglycosylase
MKIFIQKLLKFLKAFLIWVFAASIVSVVFFRFIPPPFTPLMLLRCCGQKIQGREIRLRKQWRSLDDISRYYPMAVIASEDQNFLNHHGFDVDAIRKAFKNNSRKNKVKGASTITQQVAKNLFLWPGRSWIRKGLEVYFTLLLEVFWSKKRIIEMYLNISEMGDGIYGAEAASKEYYKKSALRVNASQAALVAAILPNPRKWKPNRPTPYLHARQSWILRNMKRLGKPDF